MTQRSYQSLVLRYQELAQKYDTVTRQRSGQYALGQWLYHHSRDGVAVLTAGKLVVANPAFYRLSSLSEHWMCESHPELEAEFSNLPAFLCRHSGDLSRLQREGEGGEELLLSVRAAGPEPCHLTLRAEPVCVEEPDTLVVVIRDSTAQKQLEAEQSEVRRKDEHLAMLAHELRNPLSPIAAAAELILRLSDDPQVSTAAETIRRQIRYQSRIVDDLLDAARVREGKIALRREPLDLRDLLREAAGATEPERLQRGIAFELSLPEAPVPVHADPTRLLQCVVNLLTNAAKFTPTGGENRLELEAGHDLAWVRVRDTGIGIEPEMLPRIFGVFMQADESLDRSGGGLGLGLSLVKRLSELHGGGVRAASDGPGRGAELTLWLPLASDEGGRLRDESAPSSLSPLPSSLRILVVEDNRDARATLCELLETLGYAVFAAPDGPAGLETALAERPDVVVADLGLPGMDGYELAERLRERLPGVRLIALTGYSQDGDRRRAEQCGFEAYLVKPLDFPALLEALDNESGVARRRG